jgi:hypothetical protein
MAACSATTGAAPPPHEARQVVASCGAELSEEAVIPEQLAALMQHLANNMEAHARWVGSASNDAEAEHDALTRLATHYRRIATHATRAARTLHTLRDLDPAPHDPAPFHRSFFEASLRKKVDLQRSFAQLLLEHAATSKRALAGESAGVVPP